MAFLTMSKAYLCDGVHLKTLLPLSNSCKVAVMALSLVMDGHFKITISHWLLRNISHLSALELNFLQCWDPLDILVKLLGVKADSKFAIWFFFFFKFWHTKLLTQAVGSPSLILGIILYDTMLASPCLISWCRLSGTCRRVWTTGGYWLIHCNMVLALTFSNSIETIRISVHQIIPVLKRGGFSGYT